MRRVSALLIVFLVVGLVLFFNTPVDAQCSMCRAVLTNSNNAQFIRNFNIGILVLLVPPVSIFCSIFIVLRRHRGENQPGNDSGFE
jgi:hypothetical protein